MAAIYGHKWSMAYGDTDLDDTWLFGLGDLTPEQIGVGVKRCIASNDEWAPSLPMFKTRCKPEPYPYHNNLPALPVPTLTKEQKLEHIAELRSALKGKK